MLRAFCILVLTTIMAAAQMLTAAEYETLMRERKFDNGQDRQDFLGMQASANIDNIIRSSTRLIERGSADREALAFAHAWRARWLPLDDAVRDYEKALQLTSQGKAFYLVRLAEALNERDRDRAMRHFDEAIALNPR